MFSRRRSAGFASPSFGSSITSVYYSTLITDRQSLTQGLEISVGCSVCMGHLWQARAPHEVKMYCSLFDIILVQCLNPGSSHLTIRLPNCHFVGPQSQLPQLEHTASRARRALWNRRGFCWYCSSPRRRLAGKGIRPYVEGTSCKGGV